MYHANINQKKAEMPILISDIIDIRKKIIRDTRGQYTITKLYNKDKAILNVYATKQDSCKYVKQKLKREIDKSTVTAGAVGNFKTPFLATEQLNRKKARI